MAWSYLAAAAAFEIMFALSMKYAEGFTRFVPTVVTVFSVIGGIGFLTLALKTLPGQRRLSDLDRRRHPRHGDPRLHPAQ